MSVEWTEEQRQVIESRNKNLLVSAAAGSGKTAVLVERIIRMVTDPDHPIDIDKLLVMTFTNAAAAEMRERIGAAIERKLEETPEDEHLQIQAALVHHAQITTIDSFCLNLIRDHFNRLDLDPSFRIGDEGELLLLRKDVMRDMLEDYYENGGERFEQFVETYARGKDDSGIDEYIMQVYTFAQSNPFPKQWLASCHEELKLEGEERLMQTPWMQFLMEDVKRQVSELSLQETEALNVCREDELLSAYAPMLEQDVRRLAELGGAVDFEKLCGLLANLSWDRLATVRSKEVDPEKKAYVTGCRDRVKKAVGKMRELYGYSSPQEMEQDLAGTGEAVEMLLLLTEEYDRRYQEKKRERNLVDFNDLEHEALKVLCVCGDDGLSYTEVADELSAQFEEVLVDEYQDSNLVQETLLHAVSKERFGQPNVFMVGDVKQSIYRFRLARPELFLEKQESYDDYKAADSTCQKIELHRNFRSRDEVLEGINAVFYRIMTKSLGNIRYTSETALNPGAAFEATDKNTGGVPELLVADTGEASLQQLDDEAADYTAKEIEARMITAKIREMTDPERGLYVWDKKADGGAGGYRIAKYRDMVILLRSGAGWIETLLSVLMNEGIPAYAESRMGYFNTIEVETVLSMLAVIDNPMQDIALAAVLKSPAVGVTDTELAGIMAHFRKCAVKGQDRGLYAALRRYRMDYAGGEGGTGDEGEGGAEGEDGTEGENSGSTEERAQTGLAAKLADFMDVLEIFRRESAYLPIHELIYRVYERTGYYDYVSAMPAGETRKANLDMLVEKASSYEQTSYRGLFHFIRYIENLKKYDTDFGEAATVGEEDDTVRIMSIHKSKGLEFPVVFLAGMGKKFNKQDVYGKILIDPELGIGTDFLDLKQRIKTTTIKKNALRRKMELDSLGEELRVLYVAMTRAKEKLVMTGTDRHLQKTMEKYEQVPLFERQVPGTMLSTAGSYLDWIFMAMSGQTEQIRLTIVPIGELVGEELERQVKSRQTKESLTAFDTSRIYDADFRTELTDSLNYQYPYEADIRLRTEMSVSELKKKGRPEDSSGEIALAPFLFSGSSAPSDGGRGAARGTAYHRALELLPFDKIHGSGEVGEYLDRLVEQQHFKAENREFVDPEVIWNFLRSDLGQRMCLAQRESRLHKERQFVMGIPAKEIGAGESEELVVIQGIIDAYMEESDGLVLIDYKTDKVQKMQTLVDHYDKQLAYYQRALEQMKGTRVKEKIIYSLTLQQQIRC